MFRKSKTTLIVLALFVLLALTAAAPASALAAVTGCTQTHTVVSGEYLTKIADTYDVSWQYLAELNQLKDANLIYVGQVLCIKTNGITTPPATPIPAGSVQVYAYSAVEDYSVVLNAKTLDANSYYTIYLSNYKSNYPIKYLIGTAKTDSTGAFSQTFLIPKTLYDVALVRITAINSRGDLAENWFINVTGTKLGGIGSAPVTVKIEDVKEDTSVKITVDNLPSNVSFDVYLGKAGSEGEGGIRVGSVHANNNGGKVTVTFNIPAELQGRAKLDLLVENTHIDQSVFTTFDND